MLYQETLRVVGNWLDEQPASWITLIGVGEVLSVRYQVASDAPAATEARFTREELLFGSTAQRGQRGVGMGTQGGYGSLLRALGYELDQLGAEEISCEELQDGFLVSYSQNREGGSAHYLVVGPKATLLEQARARRRLEAREVMSQ